MKKYFKKGFSLMLAVLMVLSCWVWIAPTQAEAASTNYTVNISAYIDNAVDNECKVTIYYKQNNGDGTATSKEFDWSAAKGNEKNTISTGFTVAGWPYQIKFYFTTNTMTQHNVQIKTIDINGVSVFNDSYTIEKGALSDGKSEETLTYNGTWGSWNFSSYWTEPYITQTNGDIGDLSLSINEIGGANTSVTGTFNKWQDQYGVEWTSSDYSGANFEYYLTGAAGGAETTFTDSDGNNVMWVSSSTNNTATVTAKALLQTIHRYNDAGKLGNVYLVAKKVGTTAAGNEVTTYSSAKINLVYPKYDWVFYGNGNGTVAETPTTKIEMAGTLVGSSDTYPNNYENDVITYDGYKYYGQTIKDYYPTGNVTKEGYTFYGFWTEQQPSGAADTSNPYAFEADFIQPIDTATYNTMTDAQKALYYPAGEKYDPKNADCLTTYGDKTYYAWWISDDITVKFYDINGKYLDTKYVKYGYVNSAFTWPTPATETYESGSYTYSNFTGLWENIDGTEWNSNGCTFTHDLILTPKYNKVDFTKTYEVTVYDTRGTRPMGSTYTKDYNYRDTAVLPAESELTPLSTTAEDYSYTFEGWSTSAPSDEDSYSGNYHVMVEDGDFDETGKAIYLATDFTVRSEVSYYPVFRRHAKSHDVSFTYKDSTGTDKTVVKTFKYGEAITAPDGVPAQYATGGYGYTFLGWTKNNADVNLDGETCVPGLAYTAKYSKGVPTPYTVSFVYRNEKGEEVIKTAQVNHGANILQETVDTLAPAETYDDGAYLLTYNGKWTYETTDGTQTATTAELVDISPKNHLTITAVYENPVPFYTVTYKDGATTKDYRITEGSTLPYWYVTGADGADETYLPTRDDTVEGKYTFTGWFDAEEGGNKYVPGETKVTSNVTLYPQFSFGKFEYHIVFVNYDGTELAKGTFNYHDDVTALTAKAEAAAKRDADDTYTYQFIGWDKRVPTTCEGGEPDSTITFTAQYKPVYIYYNVEWYNGIDANGNLEGEALATSKYVYGDKMHTPSVTLTPPANTSGTAQEYVFAGWYYKDAAGAEHQFTRNLTLTKDIMDANKVVKMYAKYVLTDLTYTVTVVIDDDTSYEFTVTAGTNIKDLVSDPASGYVDTEYHNEFSGWTTGAAGGTAFDIENATISADTTIYANFKVDKHEYTLSQVTVVPTYPMPELKDEDGNVLVAASEGLGKREKWCACDTKRENVQTEDIPALTDTVAPTGTCYIGTQWKTGDKIETVYANPKTDLIVTTTDKGDVNAEFNATGKGIGVQKIEAIIVSEEQADLGKAVFDGGYGLEIYNWTQIQTSLIAYYETWDKVPAIYKDYNANVTLKAGNYNLTDGETYWAYIKLTDKAGKVSYLGSAPFIYDATAPEVTLSGDSNYNGEKFCESITVAVEEANAYTVTANGTKVEADAEGKYVISGKCYYNIVVEDAAGNKVNKYAEIMGGHSYADYKQEATCVAEGFTSKRCTVCNKDTEKEIIEKLGHDMVKTVVAATCTEDGYDSYDCSRCDMAYNNYYVVGENGQPTLDESGESILLYPKTGHTYDKNLDGKADEGATGVVGKAATCQKEGVMNYTCGTCGETLTEAIPVDGDAHNFYTPVIVKPNCTQAGKATKTCRYCGETVISAQGEDKTADNYDASLAPKGHDDGKYVVTKEATCKEDGVKTLKCTVCNATIQKDNGEGTLVDVTEAISKDTVAHTWVATKTVEPTETEKGYTVYTCSVCGKEQNGDYVDILTKYTVVIYNEAGEELHNAKYTAGDTLPADVVADQTKESTDYVKYTFAGWYTKDEDGEWDSEVKLGSAVNGNLTLYPKFTESAVFYTLQFKSPTKYDGKTFSDYELVKELMGAIGDTRVPAATPTMAEDDYYTYEFQGWTKAGEEFDDNASIVVAGDETYEAVFKPVAKTFDVIFMNGNIAVGTDKVVAGEDAEYTGETPTKAPDAEYHYAFKGWDGSLKKIMAKTTVKAEYTKTAHDWVPVKVSQKATCVLPELTDYKCSGCDKTKTEQTKAALGHTEGTPVLDEATGEYVVSCTVCKEEIRRTDATFTITFVNENNSGLDTIYVELNGAVVYDGATPTKAQTSEYRYTFAGWEAEDGTKYAVGTALPNATQDAKYKAYYTAEKRTYRVSYADSANNILYTVAEVAYGAAVPEYKGTTAVGDIPVPAYTNDEHYVFDKWDVSATTVTGNLLIRPKFKAVDHTVVKQGETSATCTQPGGIKWACTDGCGYEYIDGNVPVIAHNWVLDEMNSYEPDYTAMTPGLHVYKCSYGCGNTKEEVVPVSTRVINITVKDQNGNAVNGAQVDLYKDGEWVDIQYSNAEGKVTFYVADEGTYTVIVSGVDDADNLQYDITVGENGYDDNGNGPSINVVDCSCACHRDGFWGTIFRFFHKIIKFFTGEFNCCGCPDERYY